MARLKEHHLQLLRTVVEAGQIPLQALDGRSLRPLRGLGLVVVDGESLRATAAGRERISGERRTTLASDAEIPLSTRQEDLLRLIGRRGSLDAGSVDQRSLNALRSRGLIAGDNGQVEVSGRGEEVLRRLANPVPTRGRGRRPRTHPRSEAILKAVAELDRVLPHGAELMVGRLLCAGEDVTGAFRAYARRLAARP